jgi:ABC-type amino acid transport substrate-binding protein
MGNRTGKIMKVILAIMTIAVISTPCFAVESSISWTEDELAFMKDNPVIRLGVDPGFVPFEFIDEDDQYKGIAADYLALIIEILIILLFIGLEILTGHLNLFKSFRA